ncbi:hypothetical protein Q1695_010842 [Nippostrongylus brasiliensis]|nr:hypothetical protein Q1695_010842 [Nippostrongylus brasiliensis]
MKADEVETLCARVNDLRHEINEKQAENNTLKKDKEVLDCEGVALDAKAEFEAGLKENVDARAKGGASKSKEQNMPLEEKPENL